jgi:hypothetical protein
MLPVATRYTRAIHIERDFDAGAYALAGYQATPLVLQTLERILDSMHPTAHTRAFSLTGVYGTGKSAFGLFLAHYFSSTRETRQQLLEQHSTVPMLEGLVHDCPLLMPVLISGNNSSLRHSILQALHQKLTRQTDLFDTPPDLVAELVAALLAPNVDAQRVADLVAQSNQALVRHTTYGGTLLIIDELGQYLDYAFRQNEAADLFVLQSLAEMAGRSGEIPCVLVTILHQTFDSYAATAGAAQRTDWRKVQGRFEDMPFQEPDSQMLRMIGQALCPDNADLYHPDRQAWAHRFSRLSEELGLRPSGIPAKVWHDLLAQTYLLHPLVLLLLPMLFRQLAQNERSLFSFLTNQEPWGLQDFLHSHNQNGVNEPVYRLHHLYEYVEANMGIGLYTRSRGRRWAELAESLTRLRDPDVLTRLVLTTIGTLNVLGQRRNLRASKQIIAFALRDTRDEQTVEQALQYLISEQLITYRHHSDSYVLWEGSDLNLDALVQEAIRGISDRTDLASLLQQSIEPVPMVARKHSYQTGAVRHFNVQFVAVEDLPAGAEMPARADGEMLAIVPSDNDAFEVARQWVRHADRARQEECHRITVLPRQVQLLNDLLLEVTALRRVLKTQPELENDRVARRELASRLAEAQYALEQAVARTYYPGGQGEWWWRGAEQQIETTRDLDDLLSRVCQDTYHAALRVWNELIVRRQLPAASARARRNLVEAMLDHGHEERLALEGYPPERAIYESIFLASGIHRQEQGEQWRFGSPEPEKDRNLNLIPVWNAIQEYIDAAQHEPHAISTLFARLELPPYGVKSGLIPLLFMAVYLANAGEVTLYEHGNYVTVPNIAVFERLMRQPGNFSLRQSRAGGARMAVYERLAQKLASYALTKSVQPALLDAINPLLRLVHRLPEYSQYTRHLSEQAQAIRQALLSAREPDITLFETLPGACGVNPFAAETPFDETQFETFFTALRDGLMELQNAYSSLIAYVAERIQVAFSATTSDRTSLRQELTARCQRIINITADNQIRTLGVRLETANEGDAWIESVGALVARKPMTTWRDDDRTHFDLHIIDLGHRFCQTERVAAIIRKQQATAPTLTITSDALDKHPTRQHHPDMQSLQEQIQHTLEEQGTTLSDAQRVEVLWDILMPLIERTTESNE